MSEPHHNYHYTRDHLWLHLEGYELTIGLTEYGLSQLGEVAYFDPMPIGQTLDAGEICASLEGEEGRRAIFTPLSGEIMEINEEANQSPEMIAEVAYTDGWLLKLKLDEVPDLSAHLASGDYQRYIENLD